MGYNINKKKILKSKMHHLSKLKNPNIEKQGFENIHQQNLPPNHYLKSPKILPDGYFGNQGAFPNFEDDMSEDDTVAF